VRETVGVGIFALPESDRGPVILVLAAFVFVTVYVVNLFPSFRSPNEMSRYDLVMAIAERHSLAIEPELAAFGGYEDQSTFGGHAYSNKGPGLSLAALPVYELLRLFLPHPRPEAYAPILYGLRLATVSFATVLALWAFSARVSRLAPGRGALVLFAVAFGTPLLVYARSFFSHAWTASLLYLSFELIEHEASRPSHHFLAGLLSGWAVLSEFPAAIIVAALALDAGYKSPRRAAWFLAGGLPPAICLGLYDATCFGSPWRLSYRYEWYATHTSLSKKFFGFELPSAKVAAGYLFSGGRGILFESPAFVFLPAAASSPRVRGRAAAFSLCAVALFFAFMCGYENWHGGWSLGSRYLLPALLLSAWPLAGVGREPGPGGPALAAAVAMAVYSAAFFLFSSSTFWYLPHQPALGVRFYSAFWLSRGWHVPTLLGDSAAALAPVAAATAAATFAAVQGLFRRRSGAVIAVATGLLAFALLFAGPPPQGTFGKKIVRAWIYHVCSGRDPESTELKSLASEARTPEDFVALRRALLYGTAVPSPSP
jgi:hypothetical protein